MLGAAAAAAGSLLLVPAQPFAASAEVNAAARTLTYTAAPGEFNDAVATRAEDAVTISDPGAPIAAGPGCFGGGGPGVPVTCSVAGPGNPDLFALELHLGDRPDAVDLSAINNVDPPGTTYLELEAFGDDGPDAFTGGPGRDEFTGGRGDDTGTGGPNEDNFFADPGLDGVGVFNGGVGHDFVSYAARSAPVDVSLDAVPNDGTPGEGDNAVEIEGAVGGAGDDTLTGNGTLNILHAGAGADRLTGGGGPDELDGGEHDDILLSGPGDDHVFGAEGEDQVTAGAGDDFMDGGRGADTMFGGDDDDTLEGHGIADLLNGGSGADEIIGFNGEDTLLGGPGPDLIDSDFGNRLGGHHDGQADDVDCGTEEDEVIADALDLLANCEMITPP
jgi:hypothetical protein